VLYSPSLLDGQCQTSYYRISDHVDCIAAFADYFKTSHKFCNMAAICECEDCTVELEHGNAEFCCMACPDECDCPDSCKSSGGCWTQPSVSCIRSQISIKSSSSFAAKHAVLL